MASIIVWYARPVCAPHHFTPSSHLWMVMTAGFFIVICLSCHLFGILLMLTYYRALNELPLEMTRRSIQKYYLLLGVPHSRNYLLQCCNDCRCVDSLRCGACWPNAITEQSSKTTYGLTLFAWMSQLVFMLICIMCGILCVFWCVVKLYERKTTKSLRREY